MIRSLSRHPFKFGLTVALILILVGLFAGCGGGIRGTGGIETTEVSGRLINISGAGVAGATIRVLESGDESTTGVDGEFVILTELSADLSLAIQTANVDTTVSLGSVPSAQRTVTVTLQLDDAKESVTVISSNIPAPADPQPQVTPSSPGVNISTPIPTPELTESPNRPSPAATPTSIATAVPTSTTVPTLQPNIYRGVLRNGTGQSLRAGVVTIVDTGDSDTTDSNGHFSISTDPVSGDITIKVGSRADAPSTTIHNVPSGGGFVIDLVIAIIEEFSEDGSYNRQLNLESVNINHPG